MRFFQQAKRNAVSKNVLKVKSGIYLGTQGEQSEVLAHTMLEEESDTQIAL